MKKYVKFKDPSFVAKDAVIDLLPTRHYECKLLNRFIDNYFIDPDDTNETPLNSSTKFLTQKVLYEFIQKHSDAFPGLLTGLTRHVLIEAGIEATNEADFEEYHLNRHKFTRQRTIKNRTDTANSNASNVNHNFVESQKNMNHDNSNNSRIEGFNIYRDDNLIDWVSSETNTYSDTDIMFGIEYCYKIKALYQDGESNPTDTQCGSVIDPADFSVVSFEALNLESGSQSVMNIDIVNQYS